ncbi:hypothetical protein [Rubritalea marina]|uniref:hypothetical protein n=1 Tax=Rubritalea marina TaxID=361055 RepID=UPI000375C8F9|nr:hypothetical protein [Rubritalea marina]
MNNLVKNHSQALIGRAIFVIAALSIMLYHVTFNFNGLTSPTGIDQAQVAREVAQGQGYTTKFIRPQQVKQLQDHGKEINFHQMPETYHSPLNILVNAGILKMIGADDIENYLLGPNDKFYIPDQAIAITCSIFFLIAIGINFLLISRIFDTKIATVTAVIMLTSSDYWAIAQSGLPQMLMLTLFSTAMYLVWKSVERQKAELNPTFTATLAAFFFGLLALTHWLTIWIFIGYLIFAIFYFQPRGAVALGCATLFMVFIAPPIVYYTMQTGEPLGTAFHAIHGAQGAADVAMRQIDNVSFNVKNLLSATLHEALRQVTELATYLGGLVLAPAFFLCLVHPFRRATIADFRWGILLLWVFAVIGMSIYGLSKSPLEPNLLYGLFAPLMTAYGIAMVSIIWSRSPLSTQGGVLGNTHLIIIAILAATPLFLKVKNQVRSRNESPVVNGVHAFSLNSQLRAVTKETDLIVSDQPWAVAWYANRSAIWTPINSKNLTALETVAESRGSLISGLHVTGVSYRGLDITQTLYKNRDLTALCIAPWMANFTQVRQNQLLANNPAIAPLIGPSQGSYKYVYPLISARFEPSFYYAREDVSRN